MTLQYDTTLLAEQQRQMDTLARRAEALLDTVQSELAATEEALLEEDNLRGETAQLLVQCKQTQADVNRLSAVLLQLVALYTHTDKAVLLRGEDIRLMAQLQADALLPGGLAMPAVGVAGHNANHTGNARPEDAQRLE